MTVLLYDLAGVDDRRFSPACWPIRMALAHKGLDAETRSTPFTDIPTIADGKQKTVPVIEDGGKIVADSWVIANYLEESYPDAPSIFGGDGGMELTKFMRNWSASTMSRQIIGMVVADIHDHLLPKDQPYFRETREKRFGRTLEEVQGGRDERIEPFRQSLMPLRMTLKESKFLGGDGPRYADYVAFGVLQWSRVISPFKLLEQDDPVMAWFDRCLDLYDGMGRKSPGYDW